MLFQLLRFFDAGQGHRLFDEGLTALTLSGKGEVVELEPCEMMGGSKEADARKVIKPKDLRRIRPKSVFELRENGFYFL